MFRGRSLERGMAKMLLRSLGWLLTFRWVTLCGASSRGSVSVLTALMRFFLRLHFVLIVTTRFCFCLDRVGGTILLVLGRILGELRSFSGGFELCDASFRQDVGLACWCARRRARSVGLDLTAYSGP